jgi:hypothetical protein
MKKIGPKIYETLTPRQRLVACVEAEARSDEDEKNRLVATCPRKTYEVYDIEFSNAMDSLVGAALATEADLRGCLLGYLVASRFDPQIASTFLQDFANIRSAWKIAVNALGIDEETMARAGPPQSPVFELINDLVPEPDCQEADKLAAALRDIFDPT